MSSPLSSPAQRLSSEEARELWARYRRTGDPRLRHRLILTFAPLVKYIVYRRIRELPPEYEVDDFISCGLEALIGAIDRYDPDRGSSLEHYAWMRIEGALIDELRRADWAPRSLRRWEREMGRARERLQALHHRRPTDAELAAELELTPRQLTDRLDQLARAEVQSLHLTVLGEEGGELERIATLVSDDADTDPERVVLRAAVRARLTEAIEQLGERDRTIAVLLYVHGLSLREIGEVVGVQESRICQIHARILRALRERLSGESDLLAAAG